MKLSIYFANKAKRISILKMSTNYSNNKNKNIMFLKKSLNNCSINTIVRFRKSNYRKLLKIKVKAIRITTSQTRIKTKEQQNSN